jgi:transposase-like protein
MPWLMVTRSDISQLPRSDPFGRDDVLRSPLSLRNVEDLLAERGVRVRIIDLIVEPLGDGHYVVVLSSARCRRLVATNRLRLSRPTIA